MMTKEAIQKMATRKKTEARIEEILDLLQEECGEVIVAVSKCRRFGMEDQYHGGKTHREELVQELGDVTLLIELLHAYQLYTHQEIQDAKKSKSQKLAKYSRIYED